MTTHVDIICPHDIMGEREREREHSPCGIPPKICNLRSVRRKYQTISDIVTFSKYLIIILQTSKGHESQGKNEKQLQVGGN